MLPLLQSRAPRTLPLLIVLLWLSACAAGPISEPAIVAGSNPCRLLPLPSHTAAMREELALEIDAAPAAAVWPEIVIEHLRLTDAVRACSNVR